MEGSQELSSMDTKSPKVLNSCHARDPLLFIAPWAKLAITPSLGTARGDRTLRSDRPDAPSQRAPSQRPVNGCTPRVASVQPQSLDLNGWLSRTNSQVMTGRSTVR